MASTQPFVKMTYLSGNYGHSVSITAIVNPVKKKFKNWKRAEIRILGDAGSRISKRKDTTGADPEC